ncbi:MAG: hypothetical protein QOE36_1501 [Gaiellaceae bacterium]|jgi:hypothetical protein|nr:hypothetical protein [Gaiellaceae bacterium]
MFLLPSILLGLLFALLLGGRPSRILEVRFAAAWAVYSALAIQLVLFLPQVPSTGDSAGDVLHIATYCLLVWFALANRRLPALAPITVGMLLNGIAIAVNRGVMPLSATAARAAGIDGEHGSASIHAHTLGFLGDVFALPSRLPLSNAFSVGDLLIGFGMVGFIVAVSHGEASGRRPFALAKTLGPLHAPAYRRLIGGKLVSTIGDWLTVAALIGWTYRTTSSTGAVAALLIARLAPPIVGGGAAAYLVDRLPKARLLLWVELARAAAVAIALAGVVTSQHAAVLAALALSGALAAISSATTPALMPSLVPREQLPTANAGLGLVRNSAMALGATGGGLALSAGSAPLALAIDIATFAIAAALLAGLRIPAGAAPKPGEPRASARSYLLRRRRILLLVGSFAVATFATGLTNTTLPGLLEGRLGLGAGSYGFGIAALAAGLAIGEVTVGFSRIGSSAGRWIGVGLLLAGGLLTLLAFDTHPQTAFLFLALIGYVDGSTDILYDLVIQRSVDERYYGAVFGLSSAVTATTMVLGFALAPLLGRLVGPAGVVLISGGAFGGAGTVALVAMGRAVRERAEVAAPERPPLATHMA